MLDRTGLARKAAADDRRDDVIRTFAAGDAERLVDDETKRRASEIDFLLAAVISILPEPGFSQTRAMASLRRPVA